MPSGWRSRLSLALSENLFQALFLDGDACTGCLRHLLSSIKFAVTTQEYSTKMAPKKMILMPLKSTT
jgi:hypothetical protein